MGAVLRGGLTAPIKIDEDGWPVADQTSDATRIPASRRRSGTTALLCPSGVLLAALAI